jgi:lysophospholipase L1-like esterase
MFKFLLTGITCLLLCVTSSAQHLKIAVIGSSTAVGIGASPLDSSWVNLTRLYYESLHEIDMIYNLAVGGTTTPNGLPSADPMDTTSVTAALLHNPDVVLVSYVSNDAASDIPLATTMQNLRTIYQAVINAGKVCYITTTHPRDFFSAGQNLVQQQTRDSIIMEFPGFSLDFWDCLIAVDGVSLNTIYDSGDGVHPNNAGHQQLFQVVKSANILSTLVPLAIVTDNFTAVSQQQDVLLSWTAQTTGPADFVIQRSQDGNSFAAIGQENTSTTVSGTPYSWKDVAALPGRSYYRLQTTGDGSTSFSTVVSLMRPVADWAITNVYAPQGGSMLTVEVQSARSRNITLSIVDAVGSLMGRQTGYVTASSSRFTLPLTGLAQGQYFLRIVTEDGKVGAKAFLKW